MSVNRKVSTTTPAWLANASAVTTFIPQAARAAAIPAKSRGRSRVTRVISLTTDPDCVAPCWKVIWNGSSAKRWVISKCCRMVSASGC